MADVEQLGLAFVVQDQATGPLGDIENSYVSLMKSVDKSSGKLKKSMGGYSESLDEAGKSAEKAGDEEEKHTGKLQEAGKALKKNIIGLDEFGLSWDKIIKGLTAISIGAAIIGIGALLKKAFDAAVKFRSEFAKLNEVYALNTKESRIVGSAILGLADRAGRTRDEVMSMTKAMLDIGLTPAAAKKAGVSFKDLARDTLDLSSATGIGLESSVQFADQLLRINKIPAQNIRNIGYSIKSVADQTRISSDELVQFNKGLEPIFAFLIDKSGEGRAKFTQEMTGIAGVLSDVGIDATKATSQFAEMLDETSESGAKALGQLASFTGRSTTELRDMIKNDPSAIFDQLAKSAGRMDPSQLRLMARSLEPLGLNFSEITRLSEEFGQTNSKGFKDRVSEITALDAKENALAKAGQRRQSRVEAIQSRFGRVWENMMIKLGGLVIEKLLPPFEKYVLPMFEKFIIWLGDIDWEETFESLFKTIDDVIYFFKRVWTVTKKVFSAVGEFIGMMMGTISGLIDAGIAALTGNWEQAGEIIHQVLLGIVEFGEKHLGGLVELISEPFMKAMDIVMGTIDEVLVWMSKKVVPLLEKVASFIPGGESIVEALKGVGEAAEKRIEQRAKLAEFEYEQRNLGPRGSTVSQAIQPGQGNISVQPAALNMPSRMTTADPTAQQLLRENNQLQKEIRDEMRTKGRGGGLASAAKNNMVRRNAGG